MRINKLIPLIILSACDGTPNSSSEFTSSHRQESAFLQQVPGTYQLFEETVADDFYEEKNCPESVQILVIDKPEGTSIAVRQNEKPGPFGYKQQRFFLGVETLGGNGSTASQIKSEFYQLENGNVEIVQVGRNCGLFGCLLAHDWPVRMASLQVLESTKQVILSINYVGIALQYNDFPRGKACTYDKIPPY